MVTTNCFVGKNTPEKKLQENIQEAIAGGIVPRQVNIQRQFIPTNQTAINLNWLKKPHPVGSPGLCRPYIDKVVLAIDEFLVL